MENTRELVLDILLTLEREGGFEGKLIKAVLDKYNYLEQRDKAFIKRLAEGTIERQIELDYYIDHFSNTPVRKMKPLIRCLMRMSAYQIIYMDSVPDSAACNEACKLVQKRKFANLKGFVNAVLRNISRNKQMLSLPDPEEDYAKHLSVKYSMPQWIVEMWLAEYGDEIVKRLLEGLLDIHPVSIRFSTLLADEERGKLVQDIEGHGAKLSESGYLPYIYTAENVENVSELPGFAEGLFTVQDVSSALSVEAADITKDDFVMDICAAPGGKTILAAEKAGRVLSRDVSGEKLDLINDNLERMRVLNVTSEVFDATITDEKYIEKADVLIMDVPCSGLGVMGKKRDIKYHVTPESISSLNELQKNIVEHSWRYVKPGGTLIYSTCTINPTENEDMVGWIVDNFPFEPVPVRENLPEKLKNERLYEKNIKSEDKPENESVNESVNKSVNKSEDESEISKCCVQLLPGINASDGFFFAKLRRMQQ